MSSRNEEPQVLHSRVNRILAVVVWAICALVAVTMLSGELMSLMRTLPALALISALVWALFWHPSLRVDAASVQLHNPFRTVTVPWQALIHVDTKYAMTLVTPHKRYPAWVAPAPGALTTRFLARQSRKSGGGDRRADPGATPGELRGSESAGAAELVRSRWQAGLASGAVAAGVADTARAQVTWRTGEIALVGALLLASIASALL